MENNRLFKIIVYFLLIVSLTACNNGEPLETKETLTPFGPSSEDSFTIGLGVTSGKALSDNYFTYSIKSSEVFTPEITIVNDTPNENSFSLIFLLDYKQIPVITNKIEKYIVEKKLKPVTSEKFQISLPELTVGRHDLLVLATRESEDINSDSIYMYRRGTLIVDKDKDVEIPLNILESNKNKKLPEEVVFASKEVPETIYDSVINFSKKDAQNLYLNFHSVANRNYVILTFLNNCLINESIANPFISIVESGNIHAPISIPEILQPSNELFFAIVENPYERIEDDKGILNNIPWDVKFTDKIIIK